MGGKTGTAEILSTKEKDYLVSFIGFAPLDTPQVVVYVVVDRPNVEEQADSSYAQYIAQAILDEILPYMNIYPDEETEETTKLWDGFKGVLKLDDSEVEVDEPAVQTEGSETGTDNARISKLYRMKVAHQKNIMMKKVTAQQVRMSDMRKMILKMCLTKRILQATILKKIPRTKMTTKKMRENNRASHLKQ